MNRIVKLFKHIIKKPEHSIFSVIFLMALFFAFYKLEQHSIFEWDQERDAFVSWKMFKELKPVLIGPMVVSQSGFFLGPLWFYIIAPFYLIFNFNPIAGAFSSAVIHLVTLSLIFYLLKNTYDLKLAVISAFLYAIFITKISWNPILIPLFGFIIYHYTRKITLGYYKYIPLLFLVFGLSLQIHFQSIIFSLPIIFTLAYIYRKKRVLPANIYFAIILFVLTFLPLIVFDLRHDFINIKAFINFFLSMSANETDFGNPVVKYLTSVRYSLSKTFLVNNALIGGVITILISVLGISKLKDHTVNKINLLIILLSPLIVYSFYSGQISEYYYYVTALPILIGLSNSLGLIYQKSFIGKFITVIILAVYLIARIENIIRLEERTGLFYKKQAVLHIINQKQDPVFNVSYTTKEGQNSGFSYLFQYYGRPPTDAPEGHLWSIVIPADFENIPPLATYGDIGVIRR